MFSKYGCYKIGTANFEISILDVETNVRKIIELIKEADNKKISVLTFPELCLIGYTTQDLFFHYGLKEKIEESIYKISQSIPDNMIVAVGGPLYQNDKLYNAAYIFKKNKIVGIVPKTYLPSYNEFYEKRWFSSSKEANFDHVTLFGYDIPFGIDLIFNIGDLKVSAEICEDLWVINPPSNDYCLNGANLILNLSASNEAIAKKSYRENLVKMQSAKNYCVYVYSSIGKGESSQDLVFSGQQIICDRGNMILNNYDYIGISECVIDVEKILSDRIKYKTSFEGTPNKKCRAIEVELTEQFDKKILPNSIDAYPFILKNKEDRILRSKEIINLQAKGLATRLKNIKCDSVTIGISGGLDSTLAFIVCLEAFKMLGLNNKKINAITMPGFATSKETYKNAIQLIKLSRANLKEIDIKNTASSQLKDLNHSDKVFDTTYENVQARIRTMTLMNYANSTKSIVVGTGDLSELALGFCTFNGDHMAMYGVNASIPKTLVKLLVEDYGKINPKLNDVLEAILKTPISPELVPSDSNTIKQKTEDIIGKYDLHDFFLYYFLRYGFSKEKLYEMAKIAFNTIDKDYIKKTLNIFYARFFSQQFKRSCLPDGVKVGSICLSPRGDFRMASDIGEKNIFND